MLNSHTVVGAGGKESVGRSLIRRVQVRVITVTEEYVKFGFRSADSRFE